MTPISKAKAGRKPLGRKPTNITLPPEVKKMGMRAAFEANITFGDFVAKLIRDNCHEQIPAIIATLPNQKTQETPVVKP